MTLQAQMPQPTQARFKFLTPQAQMTIKCFWAAQGGGMLPKSP